MCQGGTGKALREWMVENAKPVDPLPVRTATAADELNGDLAAEEDGAGYTNTLRYWTDPNGWLPRPLQFACCTGSVRSFAPCVNAALRADTAPRALAGGTGTMMRLPS